MSIRDKFLKSIVTSEIVSVELRNPQGDFETVKVEVRQRTVKQQYDILDKVRNPQGEIDGLGLAVETIMACSYDPDTGDKVFDPADKDALMNVESSAFQVLLAATNKAAGFDSEEQVVSDLDEALTAAPSTS